MDADFLRWQQIKMRRNILARLASHAANKWSSVGRGEKAELQLGSLLTLLNANYFMPWLGFRALFIRNIPVVFLAIMIFCTLHLKKILNILLNLKSKSNLIFIYIECIILKLRHLLELNLCVWHVTPSRNLSQICVTCIQFANNVATWRDICGIGFWLIVQVIMLWII